MIAERSAAGLVRGAVPLGIILSALLWWRPVPASAHAYLTGTSPTAGGRLGTAPGAVVLNYSEGIDTQLSAAVVKTPDGQRVSGRVSGTEVVVNLATNAPGVYLVTWKAVSADDGHTTTGSFRFAVGTIQGPGSGGSSGRQTWQDALFSAGRTVEYSCLLLASGVLVLALLTRRDPRLAWVQPAVPLRLRLSLLAAFVATLAVVVGEAALAEGSLSIDALARFLSNGLPGGARLALLALEALALASVTAGAWWLTAALLVGTLSAVAAASHAAAIHPVVLGVAVDAVHLVAAAVWAGGILALVSIRPPGGWRDPQGRDLLERFSAVAIPAFLVSIGFGAVQGVQEVGGALSRLFTTSYGLVLLAKVAAIIAMPPLSWLAWRRRLFRRAEGGVAIAVVTIAAVLSVLPVPSSLARPAAQAGQSGLPRPGDLTLGEHAGQFLLGFTLRPGRPGVNRVLVYLKPVEGRAAGVPVDLTLRGSTVLARACGATCRQTRLTLQGGEGVIVSVAGSRGGEARFTVPLLPVPDGTELLRTVQRRMHRLSTFRLDETLSSGLGTILPAHYTFQAPNRMSVSVRSNGESHTVWIGSTRYRRGPGGRWEVQRGGPSQKVPSFIWDYFHPRIDVHVLGPATVEGVKTHILAFFANQADTPIWFRLWVDGTGLVRRAHMRAFGHFMNHRYYAFNEPLSIEPPTNPRR